MKRFMLLVLILALLSCNDRTPWSPGTTAQAFQSSTTATLTAVKFLDNNTIVAVGFSGTILKSTNAGATWVSKTSGTVNNFYSLYFGSSTVRWATGGDPLFGGGTVMKTIDAGETWMSQSSGMNGLALGIAASGVNNAWCVGNNGVAVATINGGTNWSPEVSGTTNHLYENSFANSTVGWISGSSGTMLKTTNGGSSWTPQTTNTPYSLYGLWAVNTSTAFTCGDNGNILGTTNGGTTWISEVSGTITILRNCYFANATTGWVVGDGGTIKKTVDGGTTWVSQSSGTPYALNGVHFIDANIGIVVGYGGLTIMTVNGGTTWGAGSITTTPSTPTLIAPVNVATGMSTSPTLSWNASAGAVTYDVQVSTTIDFSSFVVNDPTVTGTSKNVTGLLNSTTYYWRVNATNTFGTSAFSSVYSFTTTSPTPVFSITPISLAFGNVKIGTTKVLTFVVSNTGGGTLSVSSITSSLSQFTVSPTVVSIGSGLSANVNVTFLPTKNILYTGVITFVHNAVGSPRTDTATGTGTRK